MYISIKLKIKESRAFTCESQIKLSLHKLIISDNVYSDRSVIKTFILILRKHK